MPNSIPKPKLLYEWIKLLDNTRLPVPAGDKRRVFHALGNNQSSMGDIAKAISSSPVIALIFFREANKNHSSFARPAQNIESVVNRLGVTRCKELLNRIQETPEAEIPKALRQIWLIGEHANAQANDMFAIKLARLWQEIHWNSLLFLAPLWPLITRYPSIFALWEKRILGAKESQAQVEQELFGTSLSQLCQALAEHWALPEWIAEAYGALNHNQRLLARTLRISRLHDDPIRQRQQLDAQKDVFMWFRKPANSILLVNGMAIDAHYSWAHEHCLRWQRFSSLFLGLPLDQVQNRIHQNAVEHARKLGKTDLWHPAQSLIWPWDARRVLTAEKIARQKAAITSDLKLWQQQARQLIQRPSPFANHSQLLNALKQMLVSAGLPRCAVLSINHKLGKLQAIYQNGFKFSMHQPLAQDCKALLLQQLLNSRKPVLVTPQNLGKLKELLTQDFSAALNSSNFLLASIRLKDKPVMLLIADKCDQTLEPTDVQAFNASARYFEQALAIMYQQV